MSPAERVRAARERRSLTQYALTKKAGLTPSYVLMLERSLEPGWASNEQIKTPGLDHLQKLADALDVPVAWLAFGTEPEPDWGDRVPDTEAAPAQGAS